jgi:hypothetical protein
MEAERVEVDPTEIEALHRNLSIQIESVLREFVLNVDETGCSERGGRREMKVIFPIDCPDPSILSHSTGKRNVRPSRHASLPTGSERGRFWSSTGSLQRTK